MSQTMEEKLYKAKEEIDSSLKLTIFFLKCLGIFFTESPKNIFLNLSYKLLFCVSIFTIYFHTISDVLYMVHVLIEMPKLENIVRYFHMFGYGYLCLTRLYTLWSKRVVFGQLLGELVHIWPTGQLTSEASRVKQSMLHTLRLRHIIYTVLTFLTVAFYTMTPIAVYLFRSWRGEEASIGFIWAMWYPFDKTLPAVHVFVYIFEIYVGFVCIFITLASDLWFTAMSSHIALLLRMLHQRLKSLGSADCSQQFYYEEIVADVKLHQRLIRYCNDLEDAFTTVNFNNVVFSSVNTCCAIFAVVLLDPIFSVSNKLFLTVYLVQMFVLCWYADDIFNANAGVADAVYEGNWYNLEPRSRKLLLFLICRSQKPLGFTALKFTTIRLRTFYTILSRSYSYFAVLYTMYNDTMKQT